MQKYTFPGSLSFASFLTTSISIHPLDNLVALLADALSISASLSLDLLLLERARHVNAI
jgi:hypothetical protein